MCTCIIIHVDLHVFGPSQLSCLGSSVGRAFCLEYRVRVVRGFESHLRQLIFSRKSDCLGCAVLLCLVWNQSTNSGDLMMNRVCVYWGVHILGCAPIGVCIYWGACAYVGVCIYWGACAYVGVCIYWGVGLLGCAYVGMCIYWGVGLLGCASIGVCVYWDVHLLGCASIGVCVIKSLMT